MVRWTRRRWTRRTTDADHDAPRATGQRPRLRCRQTPRHTAQSTRARTPRAALGERHPPGVRGMPERIPRESISRVTHRRTRAAAAMRAPHREKAAPQHNVRGGEGERRGEGSGECGRPGGISRCARQPTRAAIRARRSQSRGTPLSPTLCCQVQNSNVRSSASTPPKAAWRARLGGTSAISSSNMPPSERYTGPSSMISMSSAVNAPYCCAPPAPR